MKVKLLSGSPDPEVLVCTAARNDYRSDGVIGYSFEEVMESVQPTDLHLDQVREDWAVLPNDHKDKWGSALTEAKKRTLIDHLMDSGHWGPFEHPSATIAIEGVTRVVTHQIVRHRHFTFDQQSLRYVKLDEVAREELPEKFRFLDIENDEIVDRHGVHEVNADEVDKDYRVAYSTAASYYKSLIDKGVPQEKARLVLPMGIKTNIVMSGNARAWMHALTVRTKADVQGETRECVNKIFDELKGWMPYTFEKYDEDILPLRLNP